jgi:hypothetical protein
VKLQMCVTIPNFYVDFLMICQKIDHGTSNNGVAHGWMSEVEDIYP